jgi:hypothetical protein
VVELAPYGSQAALDVAQTFPIGQLRKSHRQVLIPAGEAFEVSVAVAAGNALLEFFVQKVVDDLREDGSTSVHAALWPMSPGCPNPNEPGSAISNCSRG